MKMVTKKKIDLNEIASLMGRKGGKQELVNQREEEIPVTIEICKENQLYLVIKLKLKKIINFI